MLLLVDRSRASAQSRHGLAPTLRLHEPDATARAGRHAGGDPDRQDERAAAQLPHGRRKLAEATDTLDGPT